VHPALGGRHITRWEHTTRWEAYHCPPCIQQAHKRHTHTPTHRVGQNRIRTLYMTVCVVISLLKLPYIHTVCTYICMVLASHIHTFMGVFIKSNNFNNLNKL